MPTTKTPQLTPVFSNAENHRERIRQKAVTSVQNAFPFVGKKYTVDVSDVRLEPENFGPEDYKRARLAAGTLTEQIRGKLVLKDTSTGKVIQTVPNFGLMKLPYLTAHHNFIIDGNPYSVTNQIRLKPGVFTRKKRNEELEAQFNVGSGSPFRMTMDPSSGHFHMEYGTTRIPLYPVLRKLGVDDAEIARYWNKDLVEANRTKFDKNADKHFNKLYERIVRPERRQTVEEEGRAPAEVVRETLSRSRLDPEVTQELLGKPFESVNPEALLTASKKILTVYNNKEDIDERDSLAYKRLVGVDDFIAERVKLDARDLRRKVLTKLEYGKEKDLHRAVPTNPFTKGIRSFLSTSTLSNNPMQINPLEIMDSAMKITSMGEGGISTDRAVPMEARQLHHTHLGILDPVRTPESHGVGVELRTTMFTARDEDGNMYAPMRSRRTGKIEYVPVKELARRTVAFPMQEMRGNVDVMSRGRIRSLPAGAVDYEIPNPQSMYTISTNMIPFLDSVDGNRALMGSKMVTQALPLKDPEPPLVQAASYRGKKSMVEEIASRVVPTATVDGTVTSIRNGYITIRPRRGGTETGDEGYDTKTSAEKEAAPVKIPFFKDFPLASKTYLNDELLVKPGDKVTAGQPLADSIYVRDGQLALGKNLRMAYVPFHGMNTNDAIVVSESAAQKLTSLHMYTEGMDVEHDVRVDKNAHRSYFGNKLKADQYKQLDDDGIIKPGTRVNPGDPLVVAVQKTDLSPDARMLGKLHKSLVKPYRDASLTWEHDSPGVVTDVVRTGNKIRLTVKTEEALKVGDKLSGSYGDKGVVSAIVPDHQFLQDEAGNPIDIAIAPSSVVTRLNPAQILETALGKVAAKTGKPIKVSNYAPRDNLRYVKDELKKHGLSDTETLVDPTTGKKIPKVFVGNRYIMKLMKTTDTNYSARGVEDYDINQQPSRGGAAGAKGMGRMEFNALLAHDARNVLQEIAALKSQKNDEWWRAYQLGAPPPALRTSFAYDKFGAMLTGAGVKMDKCDNFIRLGPLTDRDIAARSSGPITRALFVRSKDLRPETGGFFDPNKTGGTQGQKWAHIDLHEPIVHPVFERPVKTFLKMTEREFDKAVREEGGAGIKQRLAQIDPAKREKEVLEELRSARADARDNLVKELKYLRALREAKMRPDEAYVISRIPVVPPVFRPLVPAKDGVLQVSDANMLYRDAFIANESLAKTTGAGLPPDVRADARRHLYDSVSAVFGTRDPVSPQLQNRGAAGFIARIAGTNTGVKQGFFHSKLMKRVQDLSGRGTIVPDATLALDEVGLPEDAGWAMYAPFIVRGLVQRGYSAMDAKKMAEDRHPIAREILVNETKNRPLMINRAPTLYRYNVLGAYPKLVPGKTLRIHESYAPIMSGDYDGDALSMSVPVSPKAVEEVRNMTLSNMLLSDQRKFTLTKAAPQQEAVSGIYRATKTTARGKVQKFKTKADAMAAYNRGEITLDTPVEIG